MTSIGNDAFSGCIGLTSLTIPSSVTSIGNDAFHGCTSLTSIIVESGNKVYDSRDDCNAIIETASNTLIRGCQNTVIPSSVASIGYAAFSSCTSLTSVTIPENVTSIDKAAFMFCTSLTSVTIPSNVTSIGNDAFYGCTSLTSVTSLIQEPFEINESVFQYWDGGYKFTSATLYVPKGTKEKYEATKPWKYFSPIIELGDVPTGVEAISCSDGAATVTERYALGGQRIGAGQRGLNIVRMSDGTVRKVVVK